MKVLYGVTGEGLGHAMRSRVVAEHLRARGHQVKLVASRRACTYLQRYFDDVEEIHGFTLAYARGGLGRTRTLYRNCRFARAAVRDSIDMYRWSISPFAPDVCVTDFDSFAHAFGKVFGRPVISIDHQHVIDRCAHPAHVARMPLTRAVVRSKTARCAHYIVTSFYRPPLRERARDTTTLVGPILRPEVLALEPTQSDHVLVYQTATRDLVEPLFGLPRQRFIVYGCGEGGTRTNVTLRGFDETSVLADLASARAVIINGGYTLMSEALYLGKPVLSVPLRRHGEQQLNAAYLEMLGLGRRAASPSVDVFRSFLARLPVTRRIEPGNAHALATIDTILEDLS